MTFLLDVNLLIAAIWTTHEHHRKAMSWVEGKKLASCAITELGFLRLSTHPKVINSDMASARTLLHNFLTEHSVKFLALDLPVLSSRARTNDALTDEYLAEFAHIRGCRLATLDRGIRHSAIEVV